MKQLAEVMRRHVIEINKAWLFDSEYTPIRILIEVF